MSVNLCKDQLNKFIDAFCLIYKHINFRSCLLTNSNFAIYKLVHKSFGSVALKKIIKNLLRVEVKN
jgi:hypothetical protein